MATPDDSASILGKPFFHYYRWGDSVLLLLLGNTMKLTAPASWNDPSECLPAFALPETLEEKIQGLADHLVRYGGYQQGDALKEARERLGQLSPEELEAQEKEGIERALRGIREESVCFCMTTNPSCALMWAHYAAGHTGVCVEFKVTCTKQAENVFLPARVNYSDEVPVISPYGDLPLDTVKAVFTTKAKCWEYEQEWRTFPTRRARLWRFPPDLISAVYAGAQMTSQDFEELRLALRMRGGNATLYRMRMRPGRFSCEPVTVGKA